MSKFTDKLLESAFVNGALKTALKVPFPGKKLAALLDEGGREQLAGLMLKLNYYDFIRAHRALYEHPRLCQKKVLQEMIRASKNTEFGRRYGFKDISSVEDFRKKVPLTTWDDYADYSEKMAKGESDVLFPGKATFFYRTSGTTSTFKYIPESEREYIARQALNKARNTERLIGAGLGAIHRVFAFYNKASTAVTEGGIPCGTASGRTSQMSGEKIQKRLAYSPQLVEELEGEALNYTIMRCTLVYDDVTAILGNNAKMMTTLIEVAEKNAEEIIEDIRRGTNKYPMSDLLKEQEKEVLTPNPKRADELLELYRQKKLIPKYYWPHLMSVGFWMGGSVGVHVDEIRKLLPASAQYVDVGYGASEAKINIPIKPDTPAGAISIFSAFYEFIPEDGGDPVLVDELEDGKSYEIVLTTYSGLYRYRLKDMIHVDGFTGKTPNIYFLSKTSDVANIAQEKITGVMLLEAISKTIEGTGLGFKTAQVYPDSKEMYYVVCIETEKEPDDIESLREQVDEGMCKELVRYKNVRNLFFKPCGIALMKKGWFEYLTKKYSKGNATAAQVKIPVVINELPDADWIEKGAY
ncbi:MAG: GH3 auxin-responsive promoter family protein [Lachnospiraceae bacterium]|nr:GH3 auxin-responsive promoter family protein [Lachnospiraceae bacterium]